MTRNTYRDSHEIVYDICKVLSEQSCGISRIATYANIALHSSMLKLLQGMIKLNLISRDKDKVYHLQLNGLIYIKRFEHLHELLGATYLGDVLRN